MKKVIFPSIGLFVLASLAFVQPQDGGYKKIATNLYQAKTFVKLSQSDADQLKKIVSTEYDIKSFKEEVTVNFKKISDPKNPNNLLGYSIADKKVGANMFSETIVNKGAGEFEEINQRSTPLPTSIKQVASIVEKYKN